jgi:hypothetical protein
VQPQSFGEPGLRVYQRDVGVVAAFEAANQPRCGGHAGVPGAQNQDLVHRSAFHFGGCYTPDASSASIRDIAFWANHVVQLKTLVSTTAAVFVTATIGGLASRPADSTISAAKSVGKPARVRDNPPPHAPLPAIMGL